MGNQKTEEWNPAPSDIKAMKTEHEGKTLEVKQVAHNRLFDYNLLMQTKKFHWSSAESSGLTFGFPFNNRTTYDDSPNRSVFEIMFEANIAIDFQWNIL